jgi:hypothetical protein
LLVQSAVAEEMEAEALVVRETRHGPVISDLDEVQRGSGAGQVLALAAANLAPGDTAAAGLLALNRAGSQSNVRENLAARRLPDRRIFANGRQHKTRRPINGAVSTLAPIGETDYPLDLRILLADQPHCHPKRARLRIPRQ